MTALDNPVLYTQNTKSVFKNSPKAISTNLWVNTGLAVIDVSRKWHIYSPYYEKYQTFINTNTKYPVISPL